MNSNLNTTNGSNDGCHSTTAIVLDGSAASRKRPSKGKQDNHQKTPKAAVSKYANGKIPPKLIMVKEIVKCQPTKALQSQLFAIAESNLTGLTKIVKKESGAAKFDSNKEHIPSSVRLLPKLDTHGDLAKTDDAIIKELAKLSETLKTCKQMLASAIKDQMGRNIRSMQMEHQKAVFRDILGIDVTMGCYFKRVHNLGLSTANMDVICKSAVLNFISSLKWLDTYLPAGTQSPLKVAFHGSVNDTTKIALEVCREGNSTTSGVGSDDFEHLFIRTRKYLFVKLPTIKYTILMNLVPMRRCHQ